jgi:hypothetical protein
MAKPSETTNAGYAATANVTEFANEVLTAEDQCVIDRFWAEMIPMQNARQKYEGRWKRLERQFDSELNDQRDDVRSRIASQMDSQSANAVIKLQIDRNILEQHIGEEGFKLPYKIVPVGKHADSDAIEITRHTVDFYVKKEDVIGEIIDFRWDRGKYGTGFLDSSIWLTRVVNNEPKDGDFQAGEFEESVSLHYHIGLRNANIWDVWFDERAGKWKDVKRCITRRRMDIEEFRATYSGKPGFKYIDAVMPVVRDYYSPEEANKDNAIMNSTARNVFIFEYYNETTGEFMLIANRRWPIYVGKSVYRDSKLPITACQMYKRTGSIYGMPVGDKTQSFLAYMNNVFEMSLDKVAVSSMPPLVMGGNGEVDGEVYSGGGDLPILNFNGDVSQIKQLAFDSRIDAHQEVIGMARNETIMNTGVNPLDYNKPLSGVNPFVAGLQEQSRKAKMALSNAMFDMALGEAMTKMLDNLIRFGPSLYSSTFGKVVDGQELETVEWFSIQVPNKKVVKARNRIRFQDAPGEFGYFELTNDLFKDKKSNKNYQMAVQVVTPTTQTLLEALKKEDFTALVGNLVQFRNMFPNDPLPVEAQDLWEMACEVYGYDAENIQSNTQTKARREEAASIIEGLR